MTKLLLINKKNGSIIKNYFLNFNFIQKYFYLLMNNLFADLNIKAVHIPNGTSFPLSIIELCCFVANTIKISQ